MYKIYVDTWEGLIDAGILEFSFYFILSENIYIKIYIFAIERK